MGAKHIKHMKWTPDEDARMRREFPHTRTETLAEAMGRTLNSVRTRAVHLGLTKTPEALVEIARGRVYDHPGMLLCRFQKGFTPWNKGKPHPSREGGQPVGTERLRDGYRERKIRMDGPYHLRWESVHVLVWEEAHGPVPPKHVVIFKDGNREHIALDNLQLMSKREQIARQGVHAHGPDIFRLHVLRGCITRAINKRERQGNE